ncbi:MAG: hypothetical protein J6U27_02350, partial [Spirochaetales bacterium]|nr:hypothetical protein [Spirochaetales bacterium]
MRKHPALLICAIFSLSFVLSSCVVSEKLTLNRATDGKSHVDISVDDFFVGVVEDLSNWDDKGNNDPILDVAVQDFEN